MKGSVFTTMSSSMWTFILWISAAVYQAEGKAGNVPFSPFFSVTLVWIITREGGGGVLPYIPYTGMCHPTGLWFWSSWFRRRYPFQRRFLERGVIFNKMGNKKKLWITALSSAYNCCWLWRSIYLMYKSNKERNIFLKTNRAFPIHKLSRTEYKKLHKH